jgi:NitT/TauT family transport system ATP-binding protein
LVEPSRRGNRVGGTIEFVGVSKAFTRNGSARPVLSDIDLYVTGGEFLAVVGASGCGKTTLLNMAAGLVEPSEGQVRYNGKAIRGVNSKIGYVTQRDNLLPWRTARDNVSLALEVRGVRRRQARAAAEETIEAVGLAGFEGHYPSELSGGMRKRVTLARSLVGDPDTLALDEPFAALDAQLKLVMQEALVELWAASGKTVVFVTHDLNEAVTLADRVVVMAAGAGSIRLIEDVDLARPRTAFGGPEAGRFAEVTSRLWDAIKGDATAAART